MLRSYKQIVQSSSARKRRARSRRAGIAHAEIRD